MIEWMKPIFGENPEMVDKRPQGISYANLIDISK